MARMLTALLCAVGSISPSVNAQDLNAEARRVMGRSDVNRAFHHIDSSKDQILAEWIRLTEINAPSGKEH